jgi:hypothetical protein
MVRLKVFSAFVAALLLLVQLVGQTQPGAMLQSAGTVNINGKAAPSSIAIFPGDRVETTQDGSATLLSQGSIVRLRGNSSFTYGNNLIDFGCGSTTVSTQGRKLAARVSNLTISPASDTNKFELARSANHLQIGEREGSLLVDDGAQKTTLESGKAMSFEGGEGCPDPPKTASETGSKAGFSLRNKKLLLISAFAAGGLTAGVVAASSSNNKKCVSPDGSGKCCPQNQPGNNNCQ